MKALFLSEIFLRPMKALSLKSAFVEVLPKLIFGVVTLVSFDTSGTHNILTQKPLDNELSIVLG